MASSDVETRDPVVIERELCKACGICIAFCPTSVLEADENGIAVVARPDDCILCQMCEFRCPDFAITVRSEEDE
ncbi:MAG: 4Fe-4S binding protein [Bacillota bacterium]